MKFDNLHVGLSFHAKNMPNERAIVFENNELTYLEFYTRVKTLAHAMINRGIKKGDHIILYMRNRIEMPVIYYAISSIGAVAVPINYMVKGKDLVQLINRSDAIFAFIEKESLQSFENALPELEKINYEHIILVGDSNDKFKHYDSLFSGEKNGNLELQVGYEELAVLIYSSGTTSLPKGIMLTQGAIITRLFRLAIEWGISYRSTVLITVPMYHSIGHHFQLLLSMLGCRIVITREFNPENTLRVIQNEKVTHSVFVPTQYIMMLQVPTFNQYDLSSLQRLISGGAPIAQPIKETIINKFNCEFSEFFGCSESGNFIYLRSKDVIRKCKSIGQQADMEVRLVDERGEDVKPGEEGEFAVRGGGLFSGYYNQPVETRKSFLEGDWFLTGDMGKEDEEGFYYLLDRKKDMIISGGVNIYSKDIEEELYSHPGVLEAAVIGAPDEKWGEKVKAFVVLKDGIKIQKEELLSYCNERLAKYQRIKELELISSLPKNPSGKILKRQLRGNENVLLYGKS